MHARPRQGDRRQAGGRDDDRDESASEFGKRRGDNTFGQRGLDTHARQEGASGTCAGKAADHLRPVHGSRQQIVFANVGVRLRRQVDCRGIIDSANGPR